MHAAAYQGGEELRLSNLLRAETIGMIAVVLSLIFVGIEIRDGNREARAATTQAALDAEMVFQAELIEHADVWQQVVVGGDMSDAIAAQRGVTLFNMAMTLEDNRYQAGRSGLLQYSDGTVKRLVTWRFFETWRQSTGAVGRSTEFIEFVDGLRNSETTE